MKIDKILALAFIALLIVGFICMGSSAIGTGMLLWLIGILVGLMAMRVHANLILQHDIAQLSKNHSPQEILATIEAVMTESKWIGAVGPGQINMRQSRVLGIVAGPVLSVSLAEKYDNTYELDLWVSEYERSAQGVPKIGDAYPKMKDKIFQAVAKYRVEN